MKYKVPEFICEQLKDLDVDEAKKIIHFYGFTVNEVPAGVIIPAIAVKDQIIIWTKDGKVTESMFGF